MSDTVAEKEMHDELNLIGLRAHATAVGLVQLCIELCKVGVLDEAATTRIKTAIVKEISLGRPRSAKRDEYEKTLHKRLDCLFSGKAAVGERTSLAMN